jgi:hypothetical protein
VFGRRHVRETRSATTCVTHSGIDAWHPRIGLAPGRRTYGEGDRIAGAARSVRGALSPQGGLTLAMAAKERLSRAIVPRLEPGRDIPTGVPQNRLYSLRRMLLEQVGRVRNPTIAAIGGERGIRTLDGLLTHTPLAGERLQPLGHLSKTLRQDLVCACRGLLDLIFETTTRMGR